MKNTRNAIIFFLVLAYISSIGQNTNFQPFPDFAISISPELPLICSGDTTKVKCNEEYESYEWEGVGFDFQAFGQQVKLTTPGQYTLTIKGEINGTFYYKILNFNTDAKDMDKDGVCDLYDCAPQNELASAGSLCNDSNPCTENDTFDEKCNCVGTPLSDCDYPTNGISDTDISELKKLLNDSFLTAMKKDYRSANLESFLNPISRIPFAHHLLENDVRAEIISLPSADILDFFEDIMKSRYSPGYLGNNLKHISKNSVRAWKGISKSPLKFRINIVIQDSVAQYMTDFDKSPNDVASEINNAKKGYYWWYHYVLGRKYWNPFLNEMTEIKSFANEIMEFNKQTEGRGKILSGSPASAINTALYYDDVLEQGASIFKTIVKNHMFYDGNKRTAAAAIKSFMTKAGIPINKTDKKFFKLAKKVATDKVVEVSDIANKLIK